jgi:hypothetical protein
MLYLGVLTSSFLVEPLAADFLAEVFFWLLTDWEEAITSSDAASAISTYRADAFSDERCSS